MSRYIVESGSLQAVVRAEGAVAAAAKALSWATEEDRLAPQVTVRRQSLNAPKARRRRGAASRDFWTLETGTLLSLLHDSVLN
ncbi:MAG TPA: hypothetical protein VGN57_10710 [Pirellulaceae bacterium]|jgi:hypothetical protein|nr:hypothetical protein [Pirellulaceae bacterium]